MLGEIIRIVATRCHILKLKCTKFRFGWGSAPDPAGGASASPQTPQLDLRGLLLMGTRGGEEKGKGRGRKGVKGEEVERGGGPHSLARPTTPRRQPVATASCR